MPKGFPGAIWMPVPEGNVFHNYGGNSPKWVVIHKTASGGTAQSQARGFQTRPDGVSVHYVVGQDGAVVQCVSEEHGAGGNCCLQPGHADFLPPGNQNLWTISIEHVDPSNDNSTPLTNEQKASSFALVADICQRQGIPGRAGDGSGGIIGHKDISPQSRARCPGNYPWDELFAHLARGVGGRPYVAGVPQGWSDDGVTLTAPNGHIVVSGFRDYVLSHSWDQADLPLQEEESLPFVEESNVGLGAGSRQIFHRHMLEWTPDLGVKTANVGQELFFVLQERVKQDAGLTTGEF